MSDNPSAEAQNAYNQGVVLFQQGDLDGAIEQYAGALRCNPRDDLRMLILANLAITKWRKNRYHERKDPENLSDEEYGEVKQVLSIYQEILNIYNKLPEDLKDDELLNEVHERALENILGFGLYGLVKKTEDGRLIRRTENSEKNLRGWGFVNDIGEDPPECVINEPLEPHLPNLNEFSRIILALTFDAGPPQNRTARNYVFYFFKGLPDLNRHPDDILVFKVKVDNPSKVHMVSKYLGGNAWFAENAPPLSQRQSWEPGWMSPHGRIKSEKFVKDMYKKQGIPEDLIDQVWRETEGIKTDEIKTEESPAHKKEISIMTFQELMVNGGEAILAKNYYQAANLFESAIKLQPNSVRAQICSVMAKIELAEKDYEFLSLLKELDFTESIILRCMSTDTNFEFDGKDEIEFIRGRCCFFLGIGEELEKRTSKYKEQAADHWRKALEINPEHHRAKNFLGTYGVKKSGCFIATAAFGNPLAEEIIILSNFRDEYLSRSSWGRKLISVYYHVSPSLASLITGKKKLCRLVRSIIIYPIVGIIKRSKE